MEGFLFRAPTKIKFGVDEALQIHTICHEHRRKKVFVVTDSVIVQTEAFDIVFQKMKAEKLEVVLYAKAVPEPPAAVINKAAEELKKSGADTVVAIGGGSSIDTAKAISMLATNEGKIEDYLFGGTKVVKNKGLMLLAIPTTAGSGSEVTSASVVSDEDNQVKLSVTHDYLFPNYAILDPKMQVSMPEFVTAATGMDALTHAIEAFVSKRAEPMSDAYACQAIEMIGKNIKKAVTEPDSMEARGNMAIASSMAAIAFANGGLGAVHGISQAMGGVAHVAHGVANAILLPYVMKKNYKGNLERFAKIAQLLGAKSKGTSIEEQAYLSVKAVQSLNAELPIPNSLQELNVAKEWFPEIIKGAMNYRLLPCNPVVLTGKDIEIILEDAYVGGSYEI